MIRGAISDWRLGVGVAGSSSWLGIRRINLKV